MKNISIITIIGTIVFLLLIFVVISYVWKTYKEPITNNGDIEYHIITQNTKLQQDNIEKQQKTLNKTILPEIYHVPLPPNIQNGYGRKQWTTSPQYIKLQNQYSYKKHIDLHKRIYKAVDKEKMQASLSVIFEDDFAIQTNTLDSDLLKIIDKMEDVDMDILLLNCDSQNLGTNFRDNIYKLNPESSIQNIYGYLVNNYSADKIAKEIIYEKNTTIQQKIGDLAKNGKLNVYCVFPALVSVLPDSTIKTSNAYHSPNTSRK